MLRISVDSQYLVNCKDMLEDGVLEKVMLTENQKC